MKTRLPPMFALTLSLALAACGSHESSQTASEPAPTATAVTPATPVATVAAAPASPTKVEEPGENVESVDVANLASPISTAVAANSPAPAAQIPSRWVPGTNFATLVPAQPTNVSPDKVEVTEIFWFGCGHCYHFDPYLENWRKKARPAYVEFSRMPVMWNDATRQHARLYYTIEALGRIDDLGPAVFHEIHVNGNPLVDRDPARTEALQLEFLKAHGVSEADFKRTYRSFDVETKLQRAEQMTRRYQVTGVPLIVVNGKYTADVGTAGGETQLLQLINDLAASERQTR
jgi:protein dithiol oxidoreductase (disulfide-forming)